MSRPNCMHEKGKNGGGGGWTNTYIYMQKFKACVSQTVLSKFKNGPSINNKVIIVLWCAWCVHSLWNWQSTIIRKSTTQIIEQPKVEVNAPGMSRLSRV